MIPVLLLCTADVLIKDKYKSALCRTFLGLWWTFLCRTMLWFCF